MQTAAIIGSGITGPMAAIMLADYGYDVDVYEARPAEDLHSDGILGITNQNWREMDNLSVPINQYALNNDFTQGNTGRTTHDTEFRYVTWTNLHTALTARAEEMGVRFHYGQPVEKSESFTGTDVVIWATGVGSAKQVSEPNYTGYVVLRGLAYQYSGMSWMTLNGDSASGSWEFNIGDTADGASIAFFVKREMTQLRTTYSAVAPAEIKDLPIRWQRVAESVPIWQQAPISDWTVPEHMVHWVGSQAVIRMGDANGQMRPQTSMGANLAINEALFIPELVKRGMQSSKSTDEYLISARHAQYTRGIKIGMQRTNGSVPSTH